MYLRSIALLSFLVFSSVFPPPLLAQPAAAGRMVMMERAHRLYNLDSLTAALAAYREVVDVIPEDSLTGYALHRMGVCAFYSGNPTEARRHYLRAVAVRKQVFGGFHNQVAKSQANLGDIYLQQGLVDSAAAVLYEATEQYPQLAAPDTVNWIRALSDLSAVAAVRQDRQLLLDAVAATDELLKAAPVRLDVYEEITHYYNAAARLSTGRLYDEARRFAQTALTLSQGRAGRHEEEGIRNVFHIIARGEGRPAEAIRQLNAAIGLHGGERSDVLAEYYYNLALLQLETNVPEAAQTSGRRALSLYAPDHPKLPYVLNTLGVTADRMGDRENALRLFNEGVATISPTTASQPDQLTRQPADSLSDANLGRLVWHLTERGDYLQRQGRTGDALTDYRDALRATQTLRDRVSSDASRQFLSRDLRPLFDRAVDLCVLLHQQTEDARHLWEALLLSDRARAYTLTANQRRGRARGDEREWELARRVARREALVAKGRLSESELVPDRLQLDRLRRRTRSTRAKNNEMNVTTLQDYLGDKNIELLQFHLSSGKGYAFHASSYGRDITYTELPGADSLTTLTDRFREQLTASAYHKKSLRAPAEQRALDASFFGAGRGLATLLIPRHWGGNELHDTRVVIVPDGPLNFLPFGALPLHDAGLPLDHGALTYLGPYLAPTLAYSVGSLLAADARVPGKGALVMAPSFGGKLPALPAAAREAAAVAGCVNNALVLNDAAATRAAFLDGAAGAGLLHLSTHGYADAREPALSYVAFSQTADTLSPEAVLYYPEIATLPLTADLAVLSACETSLGKYVPGETPLSLASAFTAAGARSTVTTLWRVDDGATADLMTAFYKELAAGHSRGLALARAQQTLRDGGDYGHPFYWSSVSLHGADGPVALGTPPAYGWWIAGGTLLLGGLIWAGTRVPGKGEGA